MDNFPTRPSAIEDAELRRRQKGRNLAMILVLAGVVVLFFAITIVKLSNA